MTDRPILFSGPMADDFKIVPVQQPNGEACVVACCAMVSGRTFDEVRAMAGKDALGSDDEDRLLVRLGILPRHPQSQTLQPDRIYLATVPSLNKRATNHRIVIDTRDGCDVYDPNAGRDGVDVYTMRDLKSWTHLTEIIHCVPPIQAPIATCGGCGHTEAPESFSPATYDAETVLICPRCGSHDTDLKAGRMAGGDDA